MAAKRIDDSKIVAVYAELKNGRAVARALGIHENTIYQVLRRFRGECLRCKAPVAHGKKSCEACLKFDQDRIKVERKRRRRLGLCQRCDKQRSAISASFCEEHRLARIDWIAADDAKKKTRRGISKRGKPSHRQRRRSILDKYGLAGVERWEADRASCQICHRPDGAVSVQVHHIDQDPSHNMFDNLACLCFDCHQAVHKLICAPSIRTLLAWFSEKYPRLTEAMPG